MPPFDHERRVTDHLPSSARSRVTETVQQGILLQQAASTVAALEYLAAREIDAAVIRRVLGGQSLREADRQALARQQPALEGMQLR